MQLSVREVNDPLAGRVFVVKGLNLSELGTEYCCKICSLKSHRDESNWCAEFVVRAGFTCNSGRRDFEVPIAGNNPTEVRETITALQVAARMEGE